MRIFQVDAFTTRRFSGNPAMVVLDADGQPDATLQKVAREFPHAEVAFVMSASDGDHDVRVRFFNARKESPFVGHATVAAHTVLLTLGRRDVGVCRQHSGVGVVPVFAAVRDGDERSMIEFRQSTPELEAPLPFKTTLRVAEALKISATHLHETMPARLARRGSTRLLVPVAERRFLEELAPNLEKLLDLGSELGAEGFFVFAVEKKADELSTESRMFCPALGIAEDPVSGNAHAMLAAYLWDMKQFGRAITFFGRQGRHVQRPGKVRVRLEVDAGELKAAHIGGTAVIVSEGTLAV